ncbi:MAG: hypothetical protein M1818_005315 [Claussenomyces sp. TS43310]|nr:MAG: hypothetical protein M1818_005315 [Claussenomyces sp. TS43310]
MEAFIRNVPEQANETLLKRFFQSVLAKLSIQCFSCQRFRRYATLVFLSKEDCLRFLSHHGQTVTSTGRSINGPRTVQLIFLNVPIYCSASNKQPDPYHLRCLELQVKQVQRHISANPTYTRDIGDTSQEDSRSFDCESVLCGVWSYENTDLVFTTHVKWNVAATAKFTARKMILEMSSGKQIAIAYNTVQNIAVTNEPSASMTFTLSAAPYFTEKNPLADLFATLSMNRSGKAQKTLPVRLSSLGGEHEKLVSNCLVYRITCLPSGFNQRMTSLRKSREIPSVVYCQTRVRRPLEPWHTEWGRLRRAFSTLYQSLPFAILFQMQKLAQNGFLPPSRVLELFPTVSLMVGRSGVQVSVVAIQKLWQQIPYAGPETEASEVSLLALATLLIENEKWSKKEETLLAEKRESENVAIIHRATVTPAGIYLYGPKPETKNRVLRKYPDHHDYFLRVQFSDEDGQPVRYDPQASTDNIFYSRFKRVLDNGFEIAGRNYAFLGFSHSSLRTQTCWFVAPFIHKEELQWDRRIIAELGDFSAIRSPAKCAARIGQAFSETPNVIPIEGITVRIAPDVERNDRVFSDGVGVISTGAMHRIWDRLPSKYLVKPSLFQIRQSDTHLMGTELVLRPSMIKFPSEDKDLELCGAAYRPLPMYLNRQLIKIMEDLGVEEKFFLDLQATAVERLRLSAANAFNAAKFLKSHSASDVALLPRLIRKLSTLGLAFQEDHFLSSVVEMAVLVELRELKYRSRILVEQGVTLYGIMDETGFLEEGEIFCIMDTPRGTQKVITGERLIITRAPALHPGDIRRVRGVTVPDDSPLMSLSNCIVFSSKGARDLPSQLSGGDLDGDLYNLIWDPYVILKSVHEPADYPRQTAIDIGRSVTRNDMTDFLILFMATDQLGRIATLHQVLADQCDDGTRNPDCIQLAELHSTAVDFSKTGIPIDLSKIPKYNRCRPDFMAPGPHVTIKKKSILFAKNPSQEASDDSSSLIGHYESDKILGKLYRAIDEHDIFKAIRDCAKVESAEDSSIMKQAWKYVERRCTAIQWEHLKSRALDIRDMSVVPASLLLQKIIELMHLRYEYCLQTIMHEYSEDLRPLSEIEVIVGNILGKTGAQSRQQRELSTSMKDCYERDVLFTINSIIKDGSEHSEEALERSIACFAVSFESRREAGRKEKLSSFTYVAGAVCLREMEG